MEAPGCFNPPVNDMEPSPSACLLFVAYKEPYYMLRAEKREKTIPSLSSRTKETLIYAKVKIQSLDPISKKLAQNNKIAWSCK
jgi:hypothetical protein